jgi:transcriptional regulator with XRE-family HTH domain
MSIHIGNIIHELIKNKGLKAKFVSKKINVSESTVYKIYKQETIDVDKLIRLSQLLNTNLFLHYLEQEPLKSMFNQKTEDLKSEIKTLNTIVSQKDKRIQELENITASQQKVISLLEKNK